MSAKETLQCCLSGAWGGLEMVAFETAIKMRASGHSVTTVCPPHSPLQKKLNEEGLPTITVQRHNKYVAPNVVHVLREALQTGKFSSVLVQQMNDLWQIVPALFGMKDVRLVAISHTFIGISKKDFLHRRIYGRLNHLIALTELHKENLLHSLPVPEERIAILPNTIDTTKFTPEKRSADFRNKYLRAPNEVLIGVVSRLDMQKGLLETLSAAAILRDQNVPFKLVIVGKETAEEPGMQTRLEQEIKSRKLENLVYLAGHRSDIDKVMASFDVLLMPSPKETFGRVLIEAMGCGIPAVATSGGGVPNIIQDKINGLLVPPLDAPAIAAALKSICENESLRKSLAKAALESAHSIYDQKKVDQKLYSLLGL
jgi:glycosyltransferase involved in cell wall biosynthesis